MDHDKRLIIPRPYPRLMFSYCSGKVIDHALRFTGAFGERGLDARLDIALIFAVTDFMDFELGGRAFSFDDELRYGGFAGLTFNL